MAGPIIKYEVIGFDQMFHGVARLAEPPGAATIGKLEMVLADQFVTSQQEVDVITGSLRLSGKRATDYDGIKWEGAITYGGPSGGPHNPVRYAQAEVARRGHHAAFLRNMYGQTYVDAYMEAIETFYEGSSGDFT